MKRKLTLIGGTSVAVLALLVTNLPAQSTGPAQAALTLTAGSSSVKGSGTPGQLPKWAGTSNPTVDVGDSIITETDSGSIGIGTKTAGSRLTVAGTVESTLGGYKFPDGTVQTTAGLAATPGNVVKSLNGLTDNVTLAAGSGVTLTPAGNTITIAAPAQNPDLTAFHTAVQLNLTGDTAQAQKTVVVPAGKRFVIEYANLDLFVFEASRTFKVLMLPTVSGSSYFYSLPTQVEGTDAELSLPVKIYADGSFPVKVDRFEGGGQTTVTLVLSGHLVDLQ
jgi:hypothetical protein